MGRPQLVARTFSLARHQRRGGDAFGPLFPKRFDLLVDLIELRDGGAPITEDRGYLRGGSFFARDLEDFAHTSRERVGQGVGGAGDAEPEAAKVVVLIVIGVPAAVVLHQAKVEFHAVGERERLFRNENGLARLVAPARTGVDAPGGVVLAVDGKL